MLAMFLTHWFQFNYAPLGQPWYTGADWPNVFVLLPLVVLSIAHSEWRHSKLHARIDAMASTHAALLVLLDPEAEQVGPFQEILDRLDPSTPTGIGAIIARLDPKGAA